MTHMPGNHGLLDLYGCDEAILKDEGRLKTALVAAAQAAEATILTEHFHIFGGAGGVTGVLLLAESHISIHTWPELRFAAIDAFICGGMKLEKVKEILCRELVAERAVWTVVQRGEGILDDIQPLVEQ
ncbi:adenosylmethionine decarboxylase [Neisseria subflava]|uniref:S-adenosylmethionine decarboxylase proenzyme n=1 Tax=Neisseria subflava TaxID=28449 RepID=A0A9X9HTE1_NEISU|nr:adenosylmethionine decarboxylase [Neisseria subflava]UTG69211.1 adenosylmethionine decarboxylase [Neisseria subflava]